MGPIDVGHKPNARSSFRIWLKGFSHHERSLKRQQQTVKAGKPSDCFSGCKISQQNAAHQVRSTNPNVNHISNGFPTVALPVTTTNFLQVENIVEIEFRGRTSFLNLSRKKVFYGCRSTACSQSLIVEILLVAFKMGFKTTQTLCSSYTNLYLTGAYLSNCLTTHSKVSGTVLISREMKRDQLPKLTFLQSQDFPQLLNKSI